MSLWLDWKFIKIFKFTGKLTFVGLVTMLTVLMALPFSEVSFAHPPVQGPDAEPGGDDLVFKISTYDADNGASTISTQETILDAAYFGSQGAMENLVLSADGLHLAPGATQGSYTSAPIASPLAVTTDLAPSWRATLPAETGLKMETRLSTDGLTWTAWAENPEGFYPVRGDEHGGTLIWLGSRGPVFSQIRLSLSAASGSQSPTFHHLTLVFSDSSDGPSDAAISAQMPVESAANVCPVERPPVVTRTQWGAPDGQGSPRWLAERTNVSHVIIHHTATPSSLAEWNRRSPYYQISDWATVVRAIWNHHANIFGWGDIGYNYLVDPNGTIYEGRAGSEGGKFDVAGAHDGRNRHSLGLGFIGCYGNCERLGLQNTQPPQTMVNKGVELIAWKVGANGLDPKGEAFYHGQLIPTIAGGRDVVYTHSPGDILYNTWLPWMRNAVSDRVQCLPDTSGQQCRVTDIIFDKTTYRPEEVINLTAKVTDPSGAPLSGAEVTAEATYYLAGSTETAGATASSAFELDDKAGDYRASYADTAKAGRYVFAVTAKHASYQTCSLTEAVIVETGDTPPPPPTQCAITTQAIPTTLTTGNPVTLRGDVTLDGQAVTNARVVAHISRPDASFAEVVLPWQGGTTYQAPYNDTQAQGKYNFTLTARGDTFETCEVAGSFAVTVDPDPDPEPGTAVSIQPATTQIPLCVASQGADLRVTQVSDLLAFSFELRFDPAIVQVVDADPDQSGVQILLGDVFRNRTNFVATHQVDNTNGLIDFAVTLLGSDTVSGDATLVEIDWAPRQVGQTNLVLSNVNLAGPGAIRLAATLHNGLIEVPQTCEGISGQVHLQGRTTHSGATVSDDQGRQVQTGADGSFTIASNEMLTIKFPGYLSAQIDVQAQLKQANAATTVQPASLGTITLLAGDVNEDNVIDIFDLAYLANSYQTADPTADLNTDGLVNILDLVLVAGNYQQQGPLSQ